MEPGGCVMSSGVKPSVLVAFTFAPARNRISITSAEPASAARCRAVLWAGTRPDMGAIPVAVGFVTVLGLAPWRSNNAATSGEPQVAA